MLLHVPGFLLYLLIPFQGQREFLLRNITDILHSKISQRTDLMQEVQSADFQIQQVNPVSYKHSMHCEK